MSRNPSSTVFLNDADFLPAQTTTKEGLTVATRVPTKAEMADLRFAWAVEAGVTSNSVIFARDGATVAIGTGEQDRVGCVELAIHKAYTKYADTLAFREQKLSFYELKQKAASDADARAALGRHQPPHRRRPAAACPAPCWSPTASSPSATAWIPPLPRA